MISLGLTGVDDWESAQIDSYADFLKDMCQECRPYFMAHCPDSKEDKVKLHDEVFKPAMEKYCPILEKLIEESGSGFFAKSGVSWADFFMANIYETNMEMSPDVMGKFTELKKHMERVYALPQLKEYLDKRPKSCW